MNFEVFTTSVELQDIPSYTTTITLEGQLLKLTFTWNERLGKRTILIKNANDVCYLENKTLYPNEPLELNSNAEFDDLPYKVVLQRVGDSNRVGNIFSWSKDFILCFYRLVDEQGQKLNVTYGYVEPPSTPIIPPTPPFDICQNATNQIYFESIQGIWEFYIDDFTIGEYITSGTASDFVSQVSLTYPNIFADYDGFFLIQNQDSINHKIKMIPISDTSYLNVINNPSFSENEDGSLTFCLLSQT